MEKYLEHMTEEQRAATRHLDGPALVIAGPGSGKTRVITYRIVQLIQEHDVDPGRIAAITFTNKAADEMGNRVRTVLGRDTSNMVYISTFHSLCARLLRTEYRAAEIAKRFGICDDSDTTGYILKAISITTGTHPRKVKKWTDYRGPKYVKRFISEAKQNLKTPDDLLDDAASVGEEDEKQAYLRKVYERYQSTLTACQSLDFDDLIMKAVLLLKKNKPVREKYAERILHLLVDEYQDTNHSQYELSRLLSSHWKNLFVVGDTDQSIYKFRGADITNITKLEEDHDDASTYWLEKNFRSTPEIAEVANALIAHNTGRKEKEIKAVRESGEPVRCIETYDGRQEAGFILKEIKTFVEEGQGAYQDCAILYRVHSKSRAFEEVCVAQGIPHKIIGGIGFYHREVVKNLLAYLKLMVNPYDEASFIRIYDKPKRGFGDTSFEKLDKIAQERGISTAQVLFEERYADVLSGKPLRGANDLRKVLEELRDTPQDKVADFLKKAIEITGYRKYLEDEDRFESEKRLAENVRKVDEMDELVAAADEFDRTKGGGIGRYLEWVALMQTADEDTDENHVRLMTCHAAKGLEFPQLYVVGAVEGLMPIVRETDDAGNPKSRKVFMEDIEEERRVFFVAVTRAEDRLTITHPRTRFMWGQVEVCTPSRFLNELGDTAERFSVADTTVGSDLLPRQAPQRRRGRGSRYNKRRKRY